MKLQKLIYFAHGWTLAIRNRPLVDESVEAWDWGPVFPTVYHTFKDYGNSPIEGLCSEFQYGSDGWDLLTPEIPTEDKETHKLIEKVLKEYGKFTAAQLSNLTHLEGTPWKLIRPDDSGERGAKIPAKFIRDYFIKIGSVRNSEEHEGS